MSVPLTVLNARICGDESINSIEFSVAVGGAAYTVTYSEMDDELLFVSHTDGGLHEATFGDVAEKHNIDSDKFEKYVNEFLQALWTRLNTVANEFANDYTPGYL